MLRLQLRVITFLSLLALAFTIAPAYSTTITTYTDPTAWQDAANVLGTVTFDGLAPTDGATQYTGSTGLTQDGVEFIGYTSTGSSWIQVIDTNFSPYYDFGTDDALMQEMDRPNSSAPLPTIEVVLPAGITAFGMDLFTVSPSALSYTITINGTPYTVPTDPNPTLAFWGITSDTPISSFTLTLPSSTYNGSTAALLDNFEFGTAQDLSEAPEGATFLLIGSGLIGIVVVKKWMGVKRPS